MHPVPVDVPTNETHSVADAELLPRRQRPRRRTTRFLIPLVTLVLVGNALIGERGLIVLVRSHQRLATVSELIGSLRDENQSLREEVRLLREEPRKIEELARRELGLIEPGEKVFILGPPGASGP